MSPLGHQTLASIGPLLMILCGAFVGGYTTILVSDLKSEGSQYPISMDEESWLASLPTIAMAVGSLFGGWLMELIGRRATSILVILINFIGWGFIYFARGIPYLMTGRFISGFCTGVCSPTSSSYLGEMASPKYRSFFTSAVIFFTSLGFLMVHLLGVFYDWRIVALWAMLLPFFAAVAVVLVPESHLWYIRKNRMEQSRKAFRWFRGDDSLAEEELKELMESTGFAKPRPRSALFEPAFQKPLFIVVLLFFTLQFSGNNTILFYSIEIIQSAAPISNTYATLIAMDAIRALFCAIGCVLVKNCRSRPLAMISGVGCSISLFLVAFFKYLNDTYPKTGWTHYIPLLGLLFYTALINVGVRPLCWSMVGALFGPSTRGLGGGISTCINFTFFFLILKVSPYMIKYWGFSITFFIYATLTLLGTGVLYFVQPETRGKTLKEIEDYFKN